MLRNYVLPVLSAALALFAVYHVTGAQKAQPREEPLVAPARVPFGQTIAGAGVVEARTENIAVGAHLAGVVQEVFVRVGQTVSAGEPLFRLDERQARAELKLREANLLHAEAQLARLEQMPRAEELPPSQARVREAQANLTDQQDQFNRVRRLYAQNALGEEEMIRRYQALQMAREQLARAQGEYDLLTAGAWGPDRAIAQAAVAQARAQVEQARTELDRLWVRAPVAGEVLQVNVRPGEYVGAPPGQALVVLGDVGRLHVRVDIDEHDIPRFAPGQPARATPRGASRIEVPLEFVRVEPYVIPKRSLTGANSERVDTRVLQVIYAVTGGPKVYVGQQLDVFLDAVAPAGPY